MNTNNLGVYVTFAMLGGGGGLLVGHYIAGRLELNDDWDEEIIPALEEELEAESNLRTILDREAYVTDDEQPGAVNYNAISLDVDKPDLMDVVVDKRREHIRVVSREVYLEEQSEWKYVDLVYYEKSDVLVELVPNGEDRYLDKYEQTVGDDALVSFEEDSNFVYVINDLLETNYQIERTGRKLSKLFVRESSSKKESVKPSAELEAEFDAQEN